MLVLAASLKCALLTFGAASLDVGTTEYRLAHGGQEVWGPRNRGVRIGLNLGSSHVLYRVCRDGSPEDRRWVYALAGAHVAASAANVVGVKVKAGR